VLQDEKQTNPDQLATYCIDTPQKTPAGRATAQTGDSAKLTTPKPTTGTPARSAVLAKEMHQPPMRSGLQHVNQPMIISILTYLKQP
jgi:hypothetical protein